MVIQKCDSVFISCSVLNPVECDSMSSRGAKKLAELASILQHTSIFLGRPFDQDSEQVLRTIPSALLFAKRNGACIQDVWHFLSSVKELRCGDEEPCAY